MNSECIRYHSSMKNIFSFLIYRFQAVTSEDAQYVASIPSEDSIQYMEKLKLADE